MLWLKSQTGNNQAAQAEAISLARTLKIFLSYVVATVGCLVRLAVAGKILQHNDMQWDEVITVLENTLEVLKTFRGTGLDKFIVSVRELTENLEMSPVSEIGSSVCARQV
jgi:hypothetical protein